MPNSGNTSRSSGSLVSAAGTQFDPHLSQLVIDEETSASILAVLRRLIQDCQAISGMVLDRAGQIIVWTGQGYEDQRMQLGALIAGTYASTREVARILQENSFRTLLQEGAKEKIFTEAIGDQWLVSVIFGRHTHLGLVKVLCSRATVDLAQILARTVERSKNRPRLKDTGLMRVANDTIDLLFRDESEK
ncbi:MAG: dynein regulation protein LC7 [Thermomicrobiales bacterium]|jgi:predicted regulator of Ras-like GTPase activity (Roadblock/LC7/MglB family)|nr:MAG: dynein regulation protein LC7 [Thermomicrobiales bacterium]